MTLLTLGGRDYAIRPLTLGQLRSVLPAFSRAARLDGEGSIDAAIDILAAALARDHAGLDRAALLEMEILPAELASAVARIARLSGLVAPEPETGEAPAGR
ncbi:MAG TPA: hypothetical protein VFC38_07010 [Stellaceae bacterium]|nr:hypothetical protein [Stellaceae bacterium]